MATTSAAHPPATSEMDPPPYDINLLTDQEKKELIICDTASIASATTLGVADPSFVPAKTLQVTSRGIGLVRLGSPPSEMETEIHDSNGAVVYKSKRSMRDSGTCILSDAEGNQRIKTTYFFGPGRDPILTLLDPSAENAVIRTVSKWTSRTQTFLLPDGRKMTWSYAREKGFGVNDKKGTALVLTLGDKRLAALIRNDEKRAPGSKSCSAGHGGELVFGEAVGEKGGVDEYLVIATCLLMLKKEMDVRRIVQMMVVVSVIL